MVLDSTMLEKKGKRPYYFVIILSLRYPHILCSVLLLVQLDLFKSNPSDKHHFMQIFSHLVVTQDRKSVV